MRYMLFVFLFCHLTSDAQETNLSGEWYGDLDLGGPKLNLILSVTDTLGYLQSSLDSPAQGAFGMESDTTYVEEDSLYFNISSLGAEFSGDITTPGKISGTFIQNGFNFPLEWTQEAPDTSLEDLNLRPQDPRKIDYYAENVAFLNREDSVVLAGTLTMPFDPNVNKVAILLTGSGPQNRNEELFAYNHRPFLVLSDYLTRNGIAVLRYDDRGVGQSSGNYGAATTEDFAQDARAAIGFVRSRADLADVEIGLIGHSEGGIIASMIGDEVDFLVLLGTPGIPTSELLLAQNRLLGQAQGIPDSVLRVYQRTNTAVYQHLLNYQQVPSDSLVESLSEVYRRSIEKYPEEAKASLGDQEKFIESQIMAVLSPWFRYFIQIEPSEYLEKVTIPVMAINGTLDLQVPYALNIPAIEAALAERGHEKNEIYAQQGLNHLFQTAISGSTNEYGLLTETFNEEVMADITAWIKGL